MDIIFQPKAAVARREGSIVIQAPGATGFWNSDNHTLTGYPITTSVLPDTGAYNSRVSGRFDDPRYYTGDTSS